MQFWIHNSAGFRQDLSPFGDQVHIGTGLSDLQTKTSERVAHGRPGHNDKCGTVILLDCRQESSEQAKFVHVKSIMAMTSSLHDVERAT